MVINFKKIICYLGIHSLKSDTEYNKNITNDNNFRLRCSICNNYTDYDGGVW
jgi:hypothetical protein